MKWEVGRFEGARLYRVVLNLKGLKQIMKKIGLIKLVILGIIGTLLVTLINYLTTFDFDKTQVTTGKIIGTTYNPIIGADWGTKIWYD